MILSIRQAKEKTDGFQNNTAETSVNGSVQKTMAWVNTTQTPIPDTSNGNEITSSCNSIPNVGEKQLMRVF